MLCTLQLCCQALDAILNVLLIKEKTTEYISFFIDILLKHFIYPLYSYFLDIIWKTKQSSKNCMYHNEFSSSPRGKMISGMYTSIDTLFIKCRVKNRVR